jgi:hypothetical protein
VPKQNWGHEENPNGPKILSIKKNQYDDARPNKENKNKEKELKPNTRGYDRPFWKDNLKDKRSINKHK